MKLPKVKSCSMVNILVEVDERKAYGTLFLCYAHPSEIPGIINAEFLRAAKKGKEDTKDLPVSLHKTRRKRPTT